MAACTAGKKNSREPSPMFRGSLGGSLGFLTPEESFSESWDVTLGLRERERERGGGGILVVCESSVWRDPLQPTV